MEQITLFELSVFRNHYSELKSQYAYLKRFIEKSSSLIEAEIKDFNQSSSLKKHLFNRDIRDPNEQQELMELLEQENFLKCYYRDLVRKSVLLMIFSKFEDSFRNLTTQLESENIIDSKIEDLKKDNNDLDRFRKYIKLHNVDFDIVNSEWMLIKEINLLRILFIHFYGNLKYFEEQKGNEKRNELDLVIKKYKGLALEEEILRISDDLFLYDFLDASIRFIREVVLQIEKIADKHSYEVTITFKENGTREMIKKKIERK